MALLPILSSGIFATTALKIRTRTIGPPQIILDKHLGMWYDLSVMVNSVDTKEAEIYILHFSSPYWGKAKHYVGYTTIGAENRIEKHRTGKGSLLVNYALNKKGIDFVVGLIEAFSCKPLARWREKQLKHEGHLARHCEVCQGKAK